MTGLERGGRAGRTSTRSLDEPVHDRGATRFEAIFGEYLEQEYPAVGVQLYDRTLGYTRGRDPDHPDFVIVTVFNRETQATEARLRFRWDAFFLGAARSRPQVETAAAPIRVGDDVATVTAAGSTRWGDSHLLVAACCGDVGRVPRPAGRGGRLRVNGGNPDPFARATPRVSPRRAT